MVKPVIKYILLISLIILAVLQAGFIVNRYILKPDTADSVSAISSENSDVILTSSVTIERGTVVAKVRTAVVYITGYSTAKVASRTQSDSLISFAPASFVAGDKMGSGIIFDSRGYILTNYHVVGMLTDIQVSLFGVHNKTYPSKIVSLHPELDLAVIKINTNFALPTVTIGNSDLLEVAEEVMAVGCPFSLEQSVSHGIISDTKRTVDIDGRPYIDLLQTDAVINSGNSGGALINMDGDVIGINVAIYAPTRYYCGVGFAIPINRAKPILRKILNL